MRESTSFKTLREQQGLSLKQAANLLGLDHTLVSRIENGIRLPTRDQLHKLAQLYQLDPDALLIDWLSDKVVKELEGEQLAREVLEAAVNKLHSH